MMVDGRDKNIVRFIALLMLSMLLIIGIKAIVTESLSTGSHRSHGPRLEGTDAIWAGIGIILMGGLPTAALFASWQRTHRDILIWPLAGVFVGGFVVYLWARGAFS